MNKWNNLKVLKSRISETLPEGILDHWRNLGKVWWTFTSGILYFYVNFGLELWNGCKKN